MTQPSELADRLRAVLDDLDELAIEQLRQAVADGATQRPPNDKEFARARRSIDKAIHVLDRLDD